MKLQSFTRRHKLDYESCELRYKYVPSAFRYDFFDLLGESLDRGEKNILREYCLYRNLSVSINKDHIPLYGEDEISEYYTSDYLIELIRSAHWHEVLSIIEEVVNGGLVSKEKINDLFAYHNIGYEIVKDESNDCLRVKIKYEAVISEISDAEGAAEDYPEVLKLIISAKRTLVDPKHVDIENSVSNSMAAIEAYLKEWLGKKDIKVSTLGDAIKAIKRKSLVDSDIADSLEKFYIYRNRTPNVGHGSVIPSGITENEALLILNMASSFINYFYRK